ncbi:MAG TPA: TlpA disulfide reductase family protein, partial [Candidatus Udaeobacter sp.]|nr:TlpA disulfide reductase family protein [Candidatus Udaeobacter sp.]
VLLTTLVGLDHGQETSPPPAAAVDSGPTLRLAPGSPAPEFALESVNGESVRLSDFHGQAVLIHFWATWCGPCKITMPWLVDLQSKYSARGFRVLAIALDDDATKVEIGEFADQLHVNFPVLIGNEKIAEAYGGVPAMPESFLVTRDGRIVENVIGITSKSELEKSVRTALNARAADAGPTPTASQAQK